MICKVASRKCRIFFTGKIDQKRASVWRQGPQGQLQGVPLALVLLSLLIFSFLLAHNTTQVGMLGTKVLD